MEIVENFSDQSAWDEYVQRHPEGRFAHMFAYQCIEKAYGYKPNYIAFTESGRIIGVLPLFHARSRIFGRRLISQPFIEYGGFLLDQQIDSEVFLEILDYLDELLKRQRIACLEMHGNQGQSVSSARIIRANPQELAVLPLDRTADDIWLNVISRHVRKAVRKAQREGLTVHCEINESLIRDRFYPLYLRSITRLGSLPHPLSYFLECFRAYGDRQRYVWAVKDGTPVACLLGFSCGRRISITNIVSDDRFWNLRPNDLIHWEYIKWACENGMQHFDFGSVRYGGQSQYKKKWGCELESSGYFFLANSPKDAQFETFDSSSRSIGTAGRLWNTLMPQSGARLLGPILRKHLMR